MSQQVRAAAVDLGAESGRVVVGSFDGERLSLTEAHRFVNTPLQLPTGLHWNLPGLFQEILEGLRRAGRQAGSAIASVGVDTWGVDFGLVDRTGALLGLPHHYRDIRTRGLVEKAQGAIDADEANMDALVAHAVEHAAHVGHALEPRIHHRHQRHRRRRQDLEHVVQRRHQHDVSQPESHAGPELGGLGLLREPGGILQALLLHLAQQFIGILSGLGHAHSALIFSIKAVSTTGLTM